MFRHYTMLSIVRSAFLAGVAAREQRDWQFYEADPECAFRLFWQEAEHELRAQLKFVGIGRSSYSAALPLLLPSDRNRTLASDAPAA